ncbi:hypothetical protein [Streptomyces phaeochromogenes]|uniref:hypothetical protein n=1 Tax=Streptomyces phaeochromogenes TaxID=1923 RepID=UPI002DD88B29|nr:hypothetical protein [Streptomyces phaeochromogenes]WRZ32204.1 hypothetical protein OG931_33000 [Streptomyces phaeochromogenes]
MRITHTPMSRDDALAMLGPHWPPRPGATMARIGSVAAIDHGAVAVHTAEGRPGATWWAVDGLLVPQDAGPPPSLPGCPMQTVPEPAESSPPLDTP